jgi:predicted nuclease of predicted toxin-antitoxin system
MKIWIDAQMSPAIATWISTNFADLEAIAARDLGFQKAEDLIIFFAARGADVTVMTKDSDFIDLQEKLGSPPKVIWVTCGNTSNKRLKEILTLRLSEAVRLLDGGEEVVEISGE